MTDGPVDEPSWSVSVEETPWTVVVDDAATTTVVIEETSPAEVSVAAPGPQGPRGTSILSGEGIPSNNIGHTGDFYLDTTQSALYGPKTSEGWGNGQSLIGLARDTVYFSRTGALSVASGIGASWRAATNWGIVAVTLTLIEPCAGSSVLVDLRRIRSDVDVSLLPANELIEIIEGEVTTTVNELFINDLITGDRLYSAITQVGNEVPGTGLTVQVDLQEVL